MPRKKTGERIIQERLHEFLSGRRSKQPIELVTVMVVKKGEQVPPEFRGLPQLSVDAKGVARADWEDAWCQSHWDKSSGWDNSWGECWDNTGPSQLPAGLYETRVNVSRVTLGNFSAAEKVTLARYGIVR